MSSLFEAAAPEKKEPEPKAKEPEVKPEPKETKAEPAPKEEPIKVKKAKAPVRPEIPVAQPRPVAPVAPAPAPAPVAKEEMPELYPEEQQMLDDAKELESRFPQKKGIGEKTEKFLREHAKWVNRPDFDEQDPAYQAFLRTKPQITARDIAALETARVKDTLTKEHTESLNQVKHEIFERDEAPKVKQEVNQIFRTLVDTALPDDLAAAIKEKGLETATEEFKMEVEMADMVLKAASDDIEEFKMITRVNPVTKRPLRPFDPKNPQHLRLVEMVDQVCEQLKNSNDTTRMLRQGKWFVTRKEWNGMPDTDRNNYWTYSNDEIISEGLKSVKPALQAVIDRERQKLEGRGWVRRPKAPPAAAPAAAPVVHDRSSPPPAPRPSPVPSPASTTGSNDGLDPRAKSLAGLFTS